jgi:hypothetical protein
MDWRLRLFDKGFETTALAGPETLAWTIVHTPALGGRVSRGDPVRVSRGDRVASKDAL